MKNKFAILVLLAFIFVLTGCSKLSQRTIQPSNQEKLLSLLDGIKDKADVEGSGILEYELYNVPGNESFDFQMFIRNYTQAINEYIFDLSGFYRIEDNTGLSKNVISIMTKHNRNLSITQILEPNGSTRFIFNCFNSDGKYEFYDIKAFKKNISGSSKTTKKFVSSSIAEENIKQGWAHYWRKDFDKAIVYFTEAIRIDPKNTEAYSMRGWMYNNKDDFDRSVADFTEVIRIDPKNINAYYGRGQAYYWKNDYDKTIEDYTKIIKFYPKFSEAYITRGDAYLDKENDDCAIADFNKAILLDPRNANAYYCRGRVYYIKENYDRAIVDFTDASRLDPENVFAYYWRASAYLIKEDYDRAIADFTEAIKINQEDVFYQMRGFAYYLKKDYEKAIADYEAALRIDPDYTNVKEYLEDAKQKLQEQKGKRL